MTFFYISTALFFLMLVAPLLIGVLELKRKESKALFIDLERKRDIRYFSNAFTSMIEGALDNYSGDDEIMLSKPEPVYQLKQIKTKRDTYENLVLALDHSVDIQRDTLFKKEIYAKKNLIAREGVELRAACIKKKAVLFNNVNIGRWIDSEDTLTVYDNCDLGVSATSTNLMTIGKNVTFKRLFAPEIQFGVYPDSLVKDEFEENYLYSPDKIKEVEHNVRTVRKSDLEDDVYPHTIISKHSVEVYNDLVIDGDISSNKDVVIMSGTIVYGSIFAEGNIYLRKGARVIGNLLSQNDIYLENDVVIGSKLNTSSILAKGKIEFNKNNIVYGFVNSEGGGISEKQYAEGNSEREYYFTDSLLAEEEYDFNEIDYDTFDKLALRKNEDLRKVTFNDNDRVIDKSILFGCPNIEEIVLPDSIETIEDFAFAELKSLKEINLKDCHNLKYIGNEAFRKCESLETVILPSSVEFIGEAAFIGCLNLKKVVISGKKIQYIGNYAFSACDNLDRSFADEIENVEKDAIFTDAKMSSEDSEISYFDDINRFSEAARPVVYGKADDSNFKSIVSAEKLRRMEYNKKVLAFKETPMLVYIAIIILAVFTVFNVQPFMKQLISNVFPVEEFDPSKLINHETDDPKVDILSKSRNVLDVRDTLYVYEDRIHMIYSYNESRIKKEVEGVRNFISNFPIDVNKYYMLVPGSISADEVARVEVNDLSKLMVNQLYESLSNDVVTVDVFDKLTESDDYYFYRTQNNWTSRGAYAGYEEYASLVGETITPLTEYKRRATTRFVGDMYYLLEDTASSFASEDLVESYLRNEQSNTQYVTVVSDDVYTTDEYSAIVSTSRRAYNTFLGGRVAYSVILGDATNGKTLMVVGTNTAHAMIPYLTEIYETVIFINPIYYNGTTDDVVDIIAKYKINDLLLLESVHDLPLVRSDRVKEAQ